MGGALVAILFLVLGGGFGLGIWWLFRPNPTDPLNSHTTESTTSETESSGSGDSGSSDGGGGDGGD